MSTATQTRPSERHRDRVADDGLLPGDDAAEQRRPAAPEVPSGPLAGPRTRSAIYEGWVRHRRHEPIEHSFKYRVFMPLLDLDELPDLLDRHPLWSARGRALARFDRRDYLGDPDQPLSEEARDIVEREIGRRPAGPVQLLTHLRYFGRAINPVSFWYLWDSYEPDAPLAAVIAEVTNTPWGESHCYVVERTGDEVALGGSHDKQMHVSPFMPMDQRYGWNVTEPGSSLVVNIDNLSPDGEKVFDATLSLRRTEISRASLTRALIAYPPMSLMVGLRIYWNALKLKIKGAPYFANPSGKPWEVWAERRRAARNRKQQR